MYLGCLLHDRRVCTWIDAVGSNTKHFHTFLHEIQMGCCELSRVLMTRVVWECAVNGNVCAKLQTTAKC